MLLTRSQAAVRIFCGQVCFFRDKLWREVHIDSMRAPHILAARDLTCRAEKHLSVVIPDNTGNPVLDANLYDLSRRFCGEHDPDVILQLLATVMNAAASGLENHDLEMMNTSLDELYQAEKMFLPYRNVRKITCFGSARTKPEEPSYKLAVEFGRKAADRQ